MNQSAEALGDTLGAAWLTFVSYDFIEAYHHLRKSYLILVAQEDASAEIRGSAIKQRGREKKGPPDIAPKSFPSLRRTKMVSVPSIGVIGKSALEIGQFLKRNFWMISGGPFGFLQKSDGNFPN